MPSCPFCKAQRELIDSLKKTNDSLWATNEKLTEKIIAMSNPAALHSVSVSNPEEYFGSGFNEQYVEFDKFGQKIIVTRNKEPG